jgi:hypothetical protein
MFSTNLKRIIISAQRMSIDKSYTIHEWDRMDQKA